MKNIIRELLVLAWIGWALSSLAAVERTRPVRESATVMRWRAGFSAVDAGHVHGAHCDGIHAREEGDL
jgi:hypothetical protein